MQFLQSESGAVTVDWVVLTAALVGLGLATMSVVSSGVEDVSGDVKNELARGDIIRTSFGAMALASGGAANQTVVTESGICDWQYSFCAHDVTTTQSPIEMTNGETWNHVRVEADGYDDIIYWTDANDSIVDAPELADDFEEPASGLVK